MVPYQLKKSTAGHQAPDSPSRCTTARRLRLAGRVSFMLNFIFCTNAYFTGHISVFRRNFSQNQLLRNAFALNVGIFALSVARKMQETGGGYAEKGEVAATHTFTEGNAARETSGREKNGLWRNAHSCQSPPARSLEQAETDDSAIQAARVCERTRTDSSGRKRGWSK